MTSEPYKIYNRSHCLTGFKALVEDLGGDAESLAIEAGLPLQSLSDPHTVVKHSALVGAMELAAERLDAPTFGLTLTERDTVYNGALGPHLLLARLVDNIRDWFDIGTRYWVYHSNATTSTLLFDDATDQAIFRYLELAPNSQLPQYTDCTMAMLLKLARVGTGQLEFVPNRLRLRRAAPPDITAFQDFFGCEIQFGADFDDITVDASFLDIPTLGDLRVFRGVADLYMRMSMAHVSGQNQSLDVAVNHAIAALLPTSTCSFEAVARVVGISPKKLQRQLAGQGTSYTILLDDYRASMARSLLRDTNIPVEKIAGLLGYAGAAPFIYAFNRWADTSPLRYRKDCRPDV